MEHLKREGFKVIYEGLEYLGATTYKDMYFWATKEGIYKLTKDGCEKIDKRCI